MRPIDRFNLIDKIGRELQSRMVYSDIDIYLSGFGINCKDKQPSTNSKWVYVKELLADASREIVLDIANDLEIEHQHLVVSSRPTTFWKPGYFRLFLSHLASFKVQTAKLQTALREYGISSFVAHEDIEPSKEWQPEIEAALHTMDALAALLMPGFKESNWCDQEVGVAVGKDVLVIPVRKGMDPYGFIGKYQAIQGNGKTVREVADAIFRTLVSSPKTRNKMIKALVTVISQVTDVQNAYPKLELLKSVEGVQSELLEQLKEQVEDNTVLMGSSVFVEDLNEYLASNGIGKIAKKSSLFEEFDDIPF